MTGSGASGLGVSVSLLMGVTMDQRVPKTAVGLIVVGV